MTQFDLVLMGVAAVLLIYQVVLLVRQMRSALIRGKTPGRAASAVLLGGLLALAVWRMGDLSRKWPVVVVLAAVCAAYLLGGTALGANGMFCGGRFIAYDRAAYFVIDNPAGERPRLRLSKLTREGIMELAPEQISQVEALLMEKGVPTMEEYRKKVDEATERRQSVRARKRK